MNSQTNNIISALKAACISVSILISSQCNATSNSITLFDGNKKSSLTEQGWLYLQEPLFENYASERQQESATFLDTTPKLEDKAGFFSTMHPSAPVLNRHSGYSVSFSLKVLYEAHDRPHRAGHSLLILSRDLKGIELGFWQDQIWAQETAPDFVHAESAKINTTTKSRTYEVQVLGDQYVLIADGTPILAGKLRDYSSRGMPYNMPNLIFMGDLTTSASAEVELGYISYSHFSEDAEPGLPVVVATSAD